MPSTAEFFTIDEAPELIAAVAGALPSWLSYHSFDGRPNVRPLAVETATIAEANLPAALAALQPAVGGDQDGRRSDADRVLVGHR